MLEFVRDILICIAASIYILGAIFRAAGIGAEDEARYDPNDDEMFAD